MKKELAVIERIIEEHKVIKERVKTLERAANDAEALIGFEQAKEAFMPGRLDQKKGLTALGELLDVIEQGLHKHFNYEEKELPGVVESCGDEGLSSDLNSLFLEHKDLRNRIAHSKRHVADLVSGNMSRHLWEASAYDMRAHISHTRKLLEAHVEIEVELLHRLRDNLRKAKQS
jgi:hypothetical protein